MSLSRKKFFRTEKLNYLPHNFLAEKMLLSCLLLNPESINIAVKTLSIKSFYFKNHQELFKVLIFMHQRNQSIDTLTLTTFLQEHGLLKKIGGIKVLIELINQIPNTIYLEEYIQLIKDKFLRRLLIQLGYRAINSSYITNIPLENIITEFEEQLFILTTEFKLEKVCNSTQLIYQIFLQVKQKAIYPNFSGLISGFDDLDILTQGFQKSDLIIIAGRPSIGKTAFSLTLSLNIIKSLKVPILFFSIEMSKEQLIYRLLSMETSISPFKFRNGNLSRADWLKFNKFVKILSKLPFFVDDSSSLSINEIRSKLKNLLFEQNKIGLIIIDYLQLMSTTVVHLENRTQELSKITRSLKNLAREFNIPIIALSQLNRAVENRPNKIPILSDLRESGSIEQDADLVLMLAPNYNNLPKLRLNSSSVIINLIIAKQRNGPVGNIKLLFNKLNTRYENLFCPEPDSNW